MGKKGKKKKSDEREENIDRNEDEDEEGAAGEKVALHRRKRALLSQAAVFLDVLPNYRVRVVTAAEKARPKIPMHWQPTNARSERGLLLCSDSGCHLGSLASHGAGVLQ